MSGDPYAYPGTSVLRNELGIRNRSQLDRFERLVTSERLAEGIPSGDFGASHIRSIHRHLFQDVYAWAGEFRTVPMSKAGDAFAEPGEIPGKIATLGKEISNRDSFRGLAAPEFAQMATIATAMLNNVHPFREGNGRTQMAWLAQLGEQAGHPLNIAAMAGPQWILASREAFRGSLLSMRDIIAKGMESGRQKTIFGGIDPGRTPSKEGPGR